ncbi:6-hydroxymethylpterin diphosphokinase MptE-like protein [Motilimonas sp. E26]|uniref:motility associated factor glycosyltransferase family protein n=1 Tax=Motilimonas sp. E26 TaxID=2865674 RepID=UPI001E5FCC7A|nr:6-hydroxymethylpterin diphosphokinase MptE-like protein [Motilimonas sp. E26]MCE0556217.1 DUF115 domain-containing protein [Motilimonas sp. E26]
MINQENSFLTLIAKRWPETYRKLLQSPAINPEVVNEPQATFVINGIQLTSCYNQTAEASVQCSLIRASAQEVTVYGTALGHAINQLLTREDLLKITVVILNLSVFKLTLLKFGQHQWLSNPKVDLVLARTCNQVKYPFLASPAELVLAEDSAMRLRDKVCLELDTEFIDSHHQHNQVAKEQINHNLELIKSDHDARELVSTYKYKKEVYIAAAGPTLADHYALLAQRPENTLLIAVDAALRPLDSQNIIPDIVVTIDPKPDICFEQLDLEVYRNTSLAYFPRMASSLLKRWLGPRYCSYSVGALFDPINLIYPKMRLFSAGSVLHPAVDLAVKMGADKIILVGADFGYPYDTTHAFWPTNFTIPSIDDMGVHLVKNWKQEYICTLPNLRGYLRDLEDYIALHPNVKFYSVSPNGAEINGAQLWT